MSYPWPCVKRMGKSQIQHVVSKWKNTEVTEKERAHRENFIRLRPARRPQSGISLWSLLFSVRSASLTCSFVGFRADARLACFRNAAAFAKQRAARTSLPFSHLCVRLCSCLTWKDLNYVVLQRRAILLLLMTRPTGFEQRNLNNSSLLKRLVEL